MECAWCYDRDGRRGVPRIVKLCSISNLPMVTLHVFSEAKISSLKGEDLPDTVYLLKFGANKINFVRASPNI